MLLTHVKNTINDKIFSAEATNICSNVIHRLSHIHHLFVTYSFPGCIHFKIYIYEYQMFCYELFRSFFSWDNVVENLIGKELFSSVASWCLWPWKFQRVSSTKWLKKNNVLFTCLQYLLFICLEFPAEDISFPSEIDGNVRAHPSERMLSWF